MSKDIMIVKRDGRKEAFNAQKSNKILMWACQGIANVNWSDIAIHANSQVYNGMTTSDLHKIFIKSAADMISEQTPNMQNVAANLLLYSLRKQVWGSNQAPRLFQHIKKLTKINIYDKYIMQKYSQSDIHKIGLKIKHDRDYTFTYAGIQTLVDKYLIKNRTTNQIYQTPQFAYMLIAMTLFAGYDKAVRFDYVMKCYDMLSKHKINLPTPIMSGVRTVIRQYASCCLIDTGDTLPSIFSSATAVSYYTARRSGIGLNMGRIRAIGAQIRNGEVVHTGNIPFLKVMESTVKSCSQNGIRGGGATVNYPFWHFEIEDILVLKNNAGTDNNRVRKLDYCIHFSKLFYERFKNDETITLFSPHEVQDMYEAFGKPQFDELYKKYQNDTTLKFKKKIKARSLMQSFTKERLETGRYYLLNIDHVNSHSAWKDKVYMTNLCVEITQPTVPLKHIDDVDAEIGICVLSAINLMAIENDEDLKNVCDIVVRLLDAVIDHQDYPVKAAQNFTKNRRSLGIGITNLAAYLAKNKCSYNEPKACDLVDQFCESMQYYLLQASCNMAKQLGPCAKFDRTTYSDGKLPIDHYNKNADSLVTRTRTKDWESLRANIKQYGLRHSTLTAQMPCESSSVIQNSTNGIEPVRSLITYKKSKAGVVSQIVPNYHHYKNYYTMAWQLKSNKGIMDIVSTMQKYFDMAISANVYYNYSDYNNKVIPFSVMIKDQFYAYKFGHKTLYYTNTPDADTSVDMGLKSSSDVQEKSVGCDGGACAI